MAVASCGSEPWLLEIQEMRDIYIPIQSSVQGKWRARITVSSFTMLS